LHGVDVHVTARRRALTARASASIGCTVPISFCTQMSATAAVSGVTA
jgi:hypothetical protein